WSRRASSSTRKRSIGRPVWARRPSASARSARETETGNARRGRGAALFPAVFVGEPGVLTPGSPGLRRQRDAPVVDLPRVARAQAEVARQDDVVGLAYVEALGTPSAQQALP